MSESSTPEAFVVPAGLRLDDVDGGLSIEHDGDIILHGSLGRAITRVRSNHGSVHLHMDADVREIAAPNGEVRVNGRLSADSVIGRHVHVGGDLKVQGVYGGGLEVAGSLDAARVNAEGGNVLVHGRAQVSEELVAEAGGIEIGGDLDAGTVRAPCGHRRGDRPDGPHPPGPRGPPARHRSVPRRSIGCHRRAPTRRDGPPPQR